MSWVRCEEQQCGGSTEVTLAASGRKAGTNKRVSVNDPLLHCAFPMIHCQYVVINVPDLIFRELHLPAAPLSVVLCGVIQAHTSA